MFIKCTIGMMFLFLWLFLSISQPNTERTAQIIEKTSQKIYIQTVQENFSNYNG